MKIQEIYTKKSITFTPDCKLSDAAASMCEHRHSCILICEGERICGILTERDIVRIFSHSAKIHEYSSSDICLKEVMSAEPMCVSLETTLEDAINLAQSNRMRHLPVVDEGHVLLGLVTLSDLMKSYLSVAKRVSTLSQHNEELKARSLEDPLTGLYNRRAMEIDLEGIAKASSRSGESYAIAIFDIDYFKRYNDHYGHDEGDEALMHVASLIKDNIRGSEKAYRYGGEEFLCVMQDTDIKGGQRVCERIREKLLASAMEHSESPHGVITLSMGVASLYGCQWQELFKMADNALYQAKHSGRNTICAVPGNNKLTVELFSKQDIAPPHH